MSDLVLSIGNKNIKGWKTASINTSIYGIASSFSLSIVATDEDTSIIQGSECVITYKNNIMLTGFVESINILEKPEGNEIIVEGRSKLCDLVDSTVELQKQFKNITVNQIIQKIASEFGVSVGFKQSLNPSLKSFTIEPGETAFSVIDRLAKASASLILGQPDGSLLVIDNDFKHNPTVIKYKYNLISVDIKQDLTNVFNKYIASSQKVSLAGNTNETYSATDSSIRKTRVTEIIPKNGEDLKSLVEHTAKMKKAKSLTVDCEVVDWIYTIAERVKFISKYIKGYFIIISINYNFTLKDGFTSSISLTKEESLTVKKEDINVKAGGLL